MPDRSVGRPEAATAASSPIAAPRNTTPDPPADTSGRAIPFVGTQTDPIEVEMGSAGPLGGKITEDLYVT